MLGCSTTHFVRLRATLLDAVVFTVPFSVLAARPHALNFRPPLVAVVEAGSPLWPPPVVEISDRFGNASPEPVVGVSVELHGERDAELLGVTAMCSINSSATFSAL
jgi:hypothetical protein